MGFCDFAVFLDWKGSTHLVTSQGARENDGGSKIN